MKTLNDEKEFMTQLMDMLEQQLGSHTEVVLHDLKKDYANTIVDIRNGHITGREVGGTGSNLGLEVLQGTVKDGNRFNYITQLRDNRILRSSSLYIKDDEGSLIGCLCVNTDITESVKLESYLKEMNHYDINAADKQEVFVPASSFFIISRYVYMVYLDIPRNDCMRSPDLVMRNAPLSLRYFRNWSFSSLFMTPAGLPTSFWPP